MKSASEPLVFVVRMWIQTADGTSGPQWRGSVKDVDAGLLFYVAGARDVADFIDGPSRGTRYSFARIRLLTTG